MSNADKRTVATDALETLGTIIDEKAGRDAIHLAVEPVVAGHPLLPGQNVGLVDGLACVCDKPLGIVDPFLTKAVMAGQRFWLVVYPRQITSLRHVWEHPAFPASQPIAENKSKTTSEAWLREFCANNDCPSYERVIGLIMAGTLPGDYGESYMDEETLYFNGSDANASIPPEFWDHVEIVLGKKMNNRPTHFSCSC